jgi:hypothetical protein
MLELARSCSSTAAWNWNKAPLTEPNPRIKTSVSVGVRPFPLLGLGLIVRKANKGIELVRLTAERPAASFDMFVLAEQAFDEDELSDGPVDWLDSLFRCVVEVV